MSNSIINFNCLDQIRPKVALNSEGENQTIGALYLNKLIEVDILFYVQVKSSDEDFVFGERFSFNVQIREVSSR